MNPTVSNELQARVEEFQHKHSIKLLTLLFTDVVGSTKLKQLLGERAAIALTERHHALLRDNLSRFPEAEEISTAGDSFFMVFAKPSDAVHFALLAQRAFRELARETGQPMLDRIGIHVGEVFIQDRAGERRDLFGIQIDSTARIMSLGNADQILLSRFAFDNARLVLRGFEIPGIGELSWLNHGYYEMKGVEEPIEVCEVGEAGLAALTAPDDSEKAHRFHAADAEPVLGWRPATGQVVPDTRWKLERPLGQGGFGEVWLAQHETLKQRRVLKFCFKAERARALKREATLFRVLRERFGEHPNIVAIHDVFFDKAPFYLVMDFVDGPSLDRWTGAHATLAEVPLERRIELVAQIADALQAAHDSGIIHRDVKPSNVLVADPAAEAPRAKLVDFGIGQIVNADALAGVTRLGFTQTLLYTGSGTGTPLYQAPELHAGQSATTRSDIYSLGVLLWQIVLGDFTRPLTTDWAEEIADPLLREDIRSCVAGDPQKRFPGAAQLAARLHALKDRRAASAREKARLAAIERGAYRRGIARAAAAAFVVVALVAGLAIYAFQKARAARAQSLRAERSSAAEAAAKTEVDAMLTRVQLQRVEELFSADKTGDALATLAAILRRHPEDAVTTERTVSALVNSDWLLPSAPELAHDTQVDSIAFSPDGRRLATSDQTGVSIWDAEKGVRLARSALARGEVAWSPDGLRLAVQKVKGQIFDAATLAPIGEPLLHAEAPVVLRHSYPAAEWSPDGRTLLTVSTDHAVYLWNSLTGEMRGKPLRHGNKVAYGVLVKAAHFSPDGSRVLTRDSEGKVWIWDAQNCQRVGDSLPPNGQPSSGAEWSLDGKRILITTAGLVQQWDIDSRTDFGPAIHQDSESVATTTLDPTGWLIATAATDGTVRLWDAASGQQRGPALRHAQQVTLHWSADGSRLLITETNGGSRLWDCYSVLPVGQTIPSETHIVALDPSGNRVATATRRGPAHLWKWKRGVAPSLFPHDIIVLSEQLSPDQKRLAIAGNGKVTTWDMATGKRLASPLKAEPSRGGEFYTLAWSPDGVSVLAGLREDDPAKRIFEWNVISGKMTAPPLTTGGYVTDAGYSTDGRFIFGVGLASQAKIWDATSRRELWTFKGDYRSGAIDGSGQRLLLGGSKSAQILEVPGGRKVVSDLLLAASSQFVHFSPDEKRVLTGSFDGVARVWDAVTGNPLTPPMAHPGIVWQGEFSRDGKHIVTASADSTARVWDAATGEPRGAAMHHRLDVFQARFSPDGARILTLSKDGTARLWDAASGSPLSEPFRHSWEPDGIAEPRHSGAGRYLRSRMGFCGSIHFAEFVGNGEQVLTVSENGGVWRWSVPRYETGVPWLPDLAEAVAGRKLDAQGVQQPVSRAALLEVERTIAGDPREGAVTRAARWFFGDAETRPISPTDPTSRSAQLSTLRSHRSVPSQLQALRIDPSDAATWANASAAQFYNAGIFGLSRLPAISQARHFLQQSFLRSQNEPLAWEIEGQLLSEEKKYAEALVAVNRSISLQPGSVGAWALRIALHEALGDPPAAADALDQLIAIGRQTGEPANTPQFLAKRLRIHHAAGRVSDAAQDNLLILGIAPRSEQATPAQIDLSPHFNVSLDQNAGASYALADVPRGLQTMSGTLFDVRGIVQLGGVGATPRSTDSYPHAVKGIAIAQTCQRLHFLHASSNSYDPTPRPIGSYVVHYVDGTSVEAPIILARDIADRFRTNDKLPAAPLIVAWSDTRAFSGKPRSLYLFKMTWANPHPAKVVKSIDFLSAKTDAAPFLVAITLE